jgi:hypothetical protein
MSEANQLEPLGLINDNEESSTGRRIEWMSKKQSISTIVLFAVCCVTIIVCIILGPSYFVIQTTQFDAKLDKGAAYRFSFDYAGLQIFNDFLTLDLYFNRTLYEGVPNEYNITFYYYSIMNSGTKMVQRISPTKTEMLVHFDESANISDKHRVFAKGVINFDAMHNLVMFKNVEGISIPGGFEWSYANPSISIVQVYLRFIFFVISLAVLIRLLLSDISFSTSHIAIKLMLNLDIFLLIASNPLNILSFFTESPFFPLFNSVVSSFLMANTFYVALVVLLMRGLAYKDASKVWLYSIYFVFFAAFCLITSQSIVTVMEVYYNPLSKKTNTIKGLGYAKMAIVGIYLLALFYAIFTYKTDIANEKPAYSIMSLILFMTVLTSELYSIEDPYAGTDSAMDTFSLLAVGTYVLFFNFINWPTESYESGNPGASEPQIQVSVLSNVVDD